MYLVIDNSGDNQVSFYAFLNTKWVQGFVDLEHKSLLSALTKFLSSVDKQLVDIEGIAVVVGIGKFTATRVATTMANALALSLKIPILAIDQFNENLDQHLAQTRKGIYISARYSAPANIGIKR